MLKEGLINFRFRSERQTETVLFSGDSIAVCDLKQLIEEKRMRFLKR